jgi:hypothetical protein
MKTAIPQSDYEAIAALLARFEPIAPPPPAVPPTIVIALSTVTQLAWYQLGLRIDLDGSSHGSWSDYGVTITTIEVYDSENSPRYLIWQGAGFPPQEVALSTSASLGVGQYSIKVTLKNIFNESVTASASFIIEADENSVLSVKV